MRPIERGPLGLIAALCAVLGPDGTLVMPSWTGEDDEPFDASRMPCAADLDGQVVLLGVGHDASTTLHLAEFIAGVPYRTPSYCTVIENDRISRIEYSENNHCCARFALADQWLRERGLQVEAKVGHADARLAHSRDIVGVALEHLAADPLLFLHPLGAGCGECDEARQSVGTAPLIRNIG